METRLLQLLEPLITSLGYELVLLELARMGRDTLLRLYIDHENGIGLEDCETVSREVAALMDVEDPIPQAYRLEVSSPGLDRPLTKPKHYQTFLGELAKIQTHAPVKGRKRFQGKLVLATEENCTLELLDKPQTDGSFERIVLAYVDIEKSRLVPDYTREFKR
jgi:ribosome maturation factor RimP